MKISAVQKQGISGMKKETILLDPAFTIPQLASLCSHAIENNIELVSVPSIWVKKAAELLANTNIKVAACIGYPFGWNAIEAKLAETILAMVDSASEIELYINITALKNNDWQLLAKELNTISTVVKKQGCSLNIVADPVWLTNEDMIKCCDLYGIAGINCFTLVSENGESIESALKQVRQHLADAVAVRVVSISDPGPIEGVSRYGKIVK